MRKLFYLVDILVDEPMLIIDNRLYVSNRGVLFHECIVGKVMDTRLVNSV